MSLSEYEKTQFDRLIADLGIGDPIALKKMKKKDKATAMSYAALPSTNTLLMILALINAYFFVSGVLAHNAFLANATGFSGMLLTAAIVLNSAKGVPVAYGKQQAGE